MFIKQNYKILQEFVRDRLTRLNTNPHAIGREKGKQATTLLNSILREKYTSVRHSSLPKLAEALSCTLDDIMQEVYKGEILRPCNRCGANLPLGEFSRAWVKKEKRHQILPYCRPCERSYAKERRAKNPIPHREHSKRYAKENRDKVSAYNKAYRDRNREQLRAKHRRWYQANKAKVIESDIRRAYPNAIIEDVDIDAIAQRDNYTCYLCLTPLLGRRISYEHVVPLCRGGSHTSYNLRVACLECNFKKNRFLIEEIDWLTEGQKSSILKRYAEEYERHQVKVNNHP